jgi:hypothetical protein
MLVFLRWRFGVFFFKDLSTNVQHILGTELNMKSWIGTVYTNCFIVGERDDYCLIWSTLDRGGGNTRLRYIKKKKEIFLVKDHYSLLLIIAQIRIPHSWSCLYVFRSKAHGTHLGNVFVSLSCDQSRTLKLVRNGFYCLTIKVMWFYNWSLRFFFCCASIVFIDFIEK